MSSGYLGRVDLSPWPFLATAIVGLVVVALIVLLAVRGWRRG